MIINVLQSGTETARGLFTLKAYLDNNATTRPLPSVVEAMSVSLESHFANPSSSHALGRQARRSIERARVAVAEMIRASNPTEIVFTSCGTESISQAFYSASQNPRAKQFAIVVSAVEHAAVLEVADYYRRNGAKLTTVNVDSRGNLDLGQLERSLSKTPSFVSLMLANNETGVVFAIEEAAGICKHHKAVLHIDAVQAAGKLSVDVTKLHCDYLSLSAHKFHGPKGVGALYVRSGASRRALIKGHQENGSRGGTENTPAIVGMGVAAEAVNNSLSSDMQRMRRLRDRIEHALRGGVIGCQINGDLDNRLCNTTDIYFPRKNSANLVEKLSVQGVYVSAGAACTTGGQPSHVLIAMGLGDERANSSLRFSVGKLTTDKEIDHAIRISPRTIRSSMDVYTTT